MTEQEQLRAAPETETPVNPYSLLEAVNSSSDTSHTAWLIFLGLMTYLMIAVAGVTHKDLLLETPVALPLLQVSIQQSQFFQFAPVVLVLLHLGVVSQLVLLARKALEFDWAVQALEATSRRTHPLRLELHNFFFVQAIAGPHRSFVMSAFLHAMSWLSLVVLPIILLLFIQISYLPFHDVTVTWAHRIALLVDIAMLVLIGVFLTRAETSFPLAFWRNTTSHPFTFLSTASLLLMAGFFSFFVATIPGENLDRMSAAVSWITGRQPSPPPGSERVSDQRAAPPRAGFALPFAAARSDGTLFGMFHRNLVATDLDLAPAKDGKNGDNSGLALRNRDLRYAKLDRTDFRGADLTNADLDGASLVGANLTNVRMQCADITELYLSDNRAAARCVSARSTNFSRARMMDARLAGIDARGAKFEEALLEAADFTYALLTGANFSSAHLERADFSGGTQLQGANFLIASMQGADLSGALLFLADFSSAQMQGAVLSHTDMQGALLRDTDLEGADLDYAKLQGADLTRARLRGASLRGTAVWMTMPPAEDSLQLADLAEVALKPIDALEATRIKGFIDKLEGGRIQAQMREGLMSIMNLGEAQKWASTPDAQAWQAITTASRATINDAYKGQITDFLGRLMCKSRWSSGAVATGIAKRAQSQSFRGDMPALYDRLRTKECPASETVARKPLKDLSNQVDIARGN
jgi:uncharacterized protein YjbI with pentapeptide repeats